MRRVPLRKGLALCPAFPERTTTAGRYDPTTCPPPPPALPRRILQDDGPDVCLLYSGKSSVVLNGRHVTPPAVKVDGVLATISSARLDLDALVRLDTEGLLTGILDVIRSEKAFVAAMLPEAAAALKVDRVLSRGTSRHMLKHWDRLVEWGVMSRAESQRVVLAAFTVEKRSGGLRLVCDGRKLNRLMRAPPTMLLPSIRSVISKFLSANWVIDADGVSWFYQFPLADGVDDFFGVNLAGERGPYVRAKLRSLCMGWSWAPCIAHRAACVLLPEADGVAYVDNFWATGRTQEETLQRYRAFQDRCASVGADVKEGSGGMPQSRFTALGLEFNLEARPHRYRSEPAWTQKFLSSPALLHALANTASAREFYKAFGGMIWFLYSTGRKLCYHRSALAFLRRCASALVSSPEKWDMPLPICSSVLSDFSSIVAMIRRNEWIEEPASQPTVVGWSDASDAEWAALLELTPLEPVVQGVFDIPDKHHIYVKELFGAWQAVRLAAATAPGCALDLKVDNAAAVAAINKGHSKNFFANDLLCAMFDTAAAADVRVSSTWVDTGSQRADEYTRGVRAPFCNATLPPVPDRYAEVGAMSSAR